MTARLDGLVRYDPSSRLGPDGEKNVHIWPYVTPREYDKVNLTEDDMKQHVILDTGETVTLTVHPRLPGEIAIAIFNCHKRVEAIVTGSDAELAVAACARKDVETFGAVLDAGRVLQ
jgi:hypothetical protein